MKKSTLLLVLFFISTLGFSQNKQGGDDPIPGIDIIIKKDLSSQLLPNPGNDPLIDQMNKLEFEYLIFVQKILAYKTAFFHIN